MMPKNPALVFLVAGLSKRFSGKIKQLISVGPAGESLIEISLAQAVGAGFSTRHSAGFSKIIFVVGEKTEQPFKKIFGDNYRGVPVHYAFQHYDHTKRDKPWGTADALCAARHKIDCPFIVCNGDDLYGENAFKILSAHLRNYKTAGAIGYKLGDVLSKKGGVNRAVFFLNPDNTVERLVEFFDISKENLESKKLSKDNLCSMSIFAFQGETLPLFCGLLDEFKKEHEGDRAVECLLPDTTSALIEKGKLTLQIYPATDKWLGVTYPEDEDVLRKELKLSAQQDSNLRPIA